MPWRTPSTLICLLALGAGEAHASSTGTAGYYGPAATCMSCHIPPSMRQGSISLTSPAYVGRKYTFSFTCSDATGAGGTLPVAGVNVFASCGTLSPSPAEPNTKIASGQLVHSAPVATTNNAKTWQFSWTAPSSPTSCGFNITGLIGNGDKKVTGDVTCMAMKALLVTPAPDAGPPDLARPAPDAGAKGDSRAAEGGGTRDAGGEAVSTPDAAASAGDSGEQSEEGCGCRLHRAPTDLPHPLLVLLSLSLACRAARRGRGGRGRGE